MSETIAQRYQVVEELGRGGVGRVVRALDLRLGREVAVKTLLKRGRAEDQARFVEEAQITGQLNHPNVVSVHDLGVDGDKLFMVMKLVSGEDLKKIRKRLAEGEGEATQAYGLRRLLRLFLKVCEAVAYAHARGVIHRDLKTANVMVDDDDDVLLLDWGLAKAVEDRADSKLGKLLGEEAIRSRLRASLAMARSLNLGGLAPGEAAEEASGELTVSGQIVGTPAYMPPEQADSDARLDARADVYALGAMLYELLTLSAPYQGSTYQCLRQLIEGPPPLPRVRAPLREIPAPIEAITLKAMEREAARRYPDAATLAADVRAYLDGERVSAYQESAGEAARRLAQRHRAAVATATVGFAAVVAMILFAAGRIYLEQRRVARATEELERERARAVAEEEGVARTARLAGHAAGAEAAVGRAVEALAWFREDARSALPLAGLGGATNEGPAAEGPVAEGPAKRRDSLFLAHARARAALAQAGQALDAVQAAYRADGGDLAQLTGPRAALAQVREDLDAALVETVLSVRPSVALALLGAEPRPKLAAGVFLPEPPLQLNLGAQRAVLLARGLRRWGRLDAALAALSQPAPPTRARPVAWALSLSLRDAPLAEQRTALDAAVAAAPEAGWLLACRGEVRARQGDFAGAEGDFDRATASSPRDAWVHSARFRALLPCFADSEMLTGYSTSIVADLSGGEDWEMELPARRVRVWRGTNLDEQLKQLQQRVAQGMPAWLAWRDGAELSLIANRPQDARRCAQELLEMRPDDRVGLGCLAEAHLLAQELDPALQVAEKGLARWPDDGRLNRVKGGVFLARGAVAEARPCLERGARPALTSDPWRELAECCLAQGGPEDLERGVEAARQALAHDPLHALQYGAGYPARPVPADPRPHRLLGQLRRRQGRLAEAILHHQRAFLLWAPTPHDRVEKALGLDLRDALWAGELHEELGLLNEALNFYAQAAKDPKLAAECQARMRRLQGG